MDRIACLLLVLVLAASTVFLSLQAIREAERATCATITGGIHRALGPAGSGCERHHIISARTLEATKDERSPGYPGGHGIGLPNGPVVKMPANVHRRTPNWGSDPEGRARRVGDCDRMASHPECAVRCVRRAEPGGEQASW